MATLQRTLVNAALRTPSVQHVASLPFQCLLGARASLTTEPAQGANTSVESTTARSEEDTARRRRPQYAPSALPRTCQTLSAWWHHPSALLHHRACRTQAASIASDAIHIRGARFLGYHGVLPAVRCRAVQHTHAEAAVGTPHGSKQIRGVWSSSTACVLLSLPAGEPSWPALRRRCDSVRRPT